MLRGGALGVLGVGAAAVLAAPEMAAANPPPAPRMIGFNSTGVVVKQAGLTSGGI